MCADTNRGAVRVSWGSWRVCVNDFSDTPRLSPHRLLTSSPEHIHTEVGRCGCYCYFHQKLVTTHGAEIYREGQRFGPTVCRVDGPGRHPSLRPFASGFVLRKRIWCPDPPGGCSLARAAASPRACRARLCHMLLHAPASGTWQ